MVCKSTVQSFTESLVPWRIVRQRLYQRRRKAALKAAGLCQDCGQVDAKEGRTLCQRCITNRLRAIKGLPRLPRTDAITKDVYIAPEDPSRVDRMLRLAGL